MSVSAVSSTPSSQTALYFIDAGLADLDTLLAGLPADAEVVLLDPAQDGLAQVLATLDGRSGIDALHILTHGAPGNIELGSATLNIKTLEAATASLQQLKASLADDADILFYGCDVAADDAGKELVTRISDLTGADVLVSTDLTGAIDQGGDWEFEFAVGSVQTVPLEVLGFDATLGSDGSQPGTLNNSPATWNGHTFQTRINAELTTSDPLNPFRADCRWDRYSLSDIPNGATVKVYMGNSSSIDDYLQIERNGQILTYNDDAGDGERGYDAYLSWTYQAGDVIRATTYRAGETGTYSLWIGTSATVSGGNPPPPTDIGSQPAPAPTAPTFTDSNSNLGTVADTSANDTELANITGTLTASDTTPTGTLTFSGGGTQTYGTLSVSSNGAFTFNPNEAAINTLAAGQNASHTFSVSVSDGGLSSSKNLTVNFSGDNDPPTVNGNATLPGILEDAGNTSATNAGTTVANLFGSRFADVDAGSSFKGILVTAIGDTTAQGTWRYSTDNGANWSDLTADTTLLAVHKLQFVPAANWSGTPGGLTVKVIDNNDGRSVGTATVSITVAPVNDAPTFTATTKITDTVADTAAYDTDWTGEVTTGTLAATDIDSAAPTFSIRGGTYDSGSGVWTAHGVYGTLTVDATSGAYTYTPTNTVGINALPAGKTVKDSFVFKANDAAGAYTTRELEISITGANDTPQLKTADPIADQSFSGPGFWKFQIPSDLFTDAEGAGLEYTVQVVDGSGDPLDVGAGPGILPAWLTFTESTRSFSGDPPATWNNAPLNLKVTTTDPGGASISDTFTLTLTNTGNQPPVVAIPIGRHVATPAQEQTEITFANAPLGGQTLSFNNLTVDGADDTSVTFGSLVTGADVASAVVSAFAAQNTSVYTAAIKSGSPDTVVFTARTAGDIDPNASIFKGAGTFNGTATLVGSVTNGTGGTPEYFTITFAANGSSETTIIFNGRTVTIPANSAADAVANLVTGTGDPYTNWTALQGTDANNNQVTFTYKTNGNIPDVTLSDFTGTFSYTGTTLGTITQGTGNETFEVQYSGGLGGTTLIFDGVTTTAGNGVTAANAAVAFRDALNANGAYTAAIKDGGTTTVVLTNKVGGNATNIQASDFSGTYTEGISRLTVGTPTDGGGWTYTFPAGTFSDPDTDTLTYTAYTLVGETPTQILTTSGDNPVNFDPVSRTFTGNGTGGPFLIELSATDASGSNTTVATRFQLYLDDGVDGNVTVGVAIPPQTWNGPGAKTFQIPANAFTFNDGPPDTLEYSAKLAGDIALPTWLTIDPATGILSGNPPADALASLSIVVTATEKEGGPPQSSTNSLPFTLTITSPNDAPTVIAPLADQLVEEGDAVSITTGPVFADADGSTITYTIKQADGSDLPSWLTAAWNGTNLSFTGNPPGNLPYLNIKVTGTDTGGLTAESTFTLYLQDPTATNNTGALTANEPGAVTISGATGGQINEGQTLTANAPTDPDGDPTGSVTYQWQVNLSGTWTDIAGARGQGNTLTLSNDEAGKSVKVQAFYTDGGGVAESPVSDAVSVINVETLGVATISGNAAIGEVQTVTLTDGDGLVNVTPTYQWYRSTPNADSGYAAISGATHSSYVTTSDDGDRYLKVVVAYTDNQGTTYTIVGGEVSDRTNAVIQRGQVPPVAHDDTGSVTEAGGVNNGTAGTNIVNGTTLFDNDTDLNANDTKSVTEVRLGADLGSGAMATEANNVFTLAGRFGTLTVNKLTGVYSYTVNQTNSQVEELAPSQTLTEVFNYTIADSTSLTSSAKLTITLNGANDAPTATAYPESSTVVEDLAGFVNTALILADPDLGASFALKLAVNSGRLLVDPAAATTANTAGITIKGSDTGTLTLTGNMADITNWLQGDVIKYAAPPNVLGNNIATLTFSANDGSGFVPLGTQSLNATASNDAPILDLDANNSSGKDGNNFITTFRPRGEAVAIVDGDIVITDADAGDTLVSGTVSIATGALDNEFGTTFETLTSSAGSSYAGSRGAITISGSGTPNITLSGAGTHADYVAVLKTITYLNANPNAYSGDRTISISVTDSAGVSASASNLASITAALPNNGVAVGQKIYLAGVDTGQTVAAVIDSSHFVASGPIAGLTPTSSLSFATTAAVGSPVTNVTSFSVETANAAIKADLKIFKNGTDTGLIVSSVSGSSITASGNITLAANDVLSFQTTATNNTPIPATTTVRVPWTSVVDMDGTASASRDYTTGYTEGALPVSVATSTASIDNQAINVKTFTVTLTNPLDGAGGASEELSISASMVQTLAAKGITATVAGNKHSITFTTGASGATATDMQLGLRAIKYVNNDQNPSITPRVISTSVVDVASETGVPATTTINIIPVNDAPVIGGDLAATVAEGGIHVFTAGLGNDLHPSDVDDAVPTLLYRISTVDGKGATVNGTLFRDANLNNEIDAGEAIALNGTFSQGDVINGLIKYQHAGADNLTDAFGFKLEDGLENGVTAPQNTFTITVTPTNDAPTLATDSTATPAAFSEATGTAVSLFSGATVTTGDTTGAAQNIQKLVLTVAGLVDGVAEKLTVNNVEIDLVATGTTVMNTGSPTVAGLSYAVAISGGTATVTLTHAGLTTAETQTLVNALAYRNASNAPTTTDRVITLTQIQDTGGTANAGIDTASLEIARTVTVTAVDTAPLVGTNTGTSLNDGATATIGTTKLSATDPDTADGSVVYRITDATDQGTLFRDFDNDGSPDAGEVLGLNSTFTQADLAANRIKYLHTDNLGADSFKFTVADATTTRAEATFNITVNAIAATPGVSGGGTTTASTSGATPLFPDVTVTPPSGNTVQSVSFTVTGVKDGSHETLNINGQQIPMTATTEPDHFVGADGNQYIVVDNGSGSFTVTVVDTALPGFTGPQAEALIESVSLGNDAAPPTPGTRIVTLGNVVNQNADGTTTTDTPNVTSIVNVNTAIKPFSPADVPTPPAGSTIQTLTVSVTGVKDGANEVLKVNGQDIPLVPGTTTLNGIVYAVTVDGSGNATVTVTDPTPPGWSEIEAETLLGNTTYVNNATPPTAGERSISLTSVTLVDGGGTAGTPQPVTGQGTTASPTTGGGTFPMAGDTLPDILNTSTIDSLTFKVTGVKDGSHEKLTFGTAPYTSVPLFNGDVSTADGVTPAGTYSVTVVDGTATVVFTPTTNLTEREAADLTHSARYTNTATPLTAGTREVSLTSMVVEASGGGTSTVNTPNVGSNVVVSTNSNTAPSFTGDHAFEVNEGATYTLTTSDIGASDAQLAAGSLVYKLTTPPGQGQLFRDSNGNGLVNSGEAIALNGTFTQAEVSAGTIKYRHGGNEPAFESFQLTVSDGQATTSPASVTVTVNPANDAPTLSLTAATNPSFTEGGSAATLFSSPTASTVESGQTFTQLKLTVAGVRDLTEQLVVDGVNVALTHNTSGTTVTNTVGYSVSVTGTTATVTLTHAGANATQVQNLLTGLAYQNTSDNPTVGIRDITVTELKDSGGTDRGGRDTAYLNLPSHVSVGAINSAPTLDGSGAFTVLEGGSHALTTAELIAADVDTPLSSLLYRLTTVPSKGTLFRDLNGNAINDAGDVTLAAGGTFSHAELVTGKVRYAHDGSESNDSFVIQVNDGALDAASAKTIRVTRTPVNDAPTIGNLGADTMSYPAHEGTLTYRFLDVTTSASVGVPSFGSPNATVSDVDSIDFNGGSLRVSIVFNNTPAADSLRIFNPNGGITTDPTKVYYNGDEIGTYSGGTGTNDLVVNFTSGFATPAVTEALIRSIQFANSEATPALNSRTVRFALNDGDGGATSADVNVNIQSNLRPSILNGSGFFIAENTSLVTVLTAQNPTGVSGSIVYSISDRTDASNVDAARFQVNALNGTLSFKAAPDYETPLDAGGNNIYNVVVRATSSTLNTFTESVLTVNVVDVVTETVAAGDTAGPVFGYATVNGTSLVMAYTDASNLDATNAPPTSAFTVSGNTVTAVVVDAIAKTVTLTLGTAVVAGATVTVAYTDPTDGNDTAALQDAAGNDAAALAAISVTNITPSSGGGGSGGGSSGGGSTGGGSTGGGSTGGGSTPVPGIPSKDDWANLPDDDGDGLPELVEDFVPQPYVPGAVIGDGNGDGAKDSTQVDVASSPFLLTPTAVSNPGQAPNSFVTLVADSIGGKTDTRDGNQAQIRAIEQLDAASSKPGTMTMPLGMLSFVADVQNASELETFSLYVDPALGVNGYWMQNTAGTWVNLASPAHGGQMVLEGGRLRIDFQLQDGGVFDADGRADGVISAPGTVAFMPLSIVGTQPDTGENDFWF